MKGLEMRSEMRTIGDFLVLTLIVACIIGVIAFLFTYPNAFVYTYAGIGIVVLIGSLKQ